MFIRESKVVGDMQQSAVDRLSLDIQLARAAQDGTKSQIIKLLRKGADRNFRASDGGTTPLHSAAFAGNLDAINVLTEGHLELVDVPDNDGWSPLHCTLTTDKIDAMRLLLRLGANPLHLDAKGNNPLFHAMISLYTSTGLEFLKLVPEHNETLLNHKNLTGQTLLHVAIEHKSKRWVQALLKLNVNAELRDNDGRTPLLVAVSNNADECIEHLLGKPVDITVADNQGQTVLHIAIEKMHINLVRLFLSLQNVRTILNKKDSQGLTPLMLAASAGKIAAVKLLLDAGASITEVDLAGKNVIQILEDLLRQLKDKDAMFAAIQACLTLLSSSNQNNIRQYEMDGNHDNAIKNLDKPAANQKKKPKKKKAAAVQPVIASAPIVLETTSAEINANSPDVVFCDGPNEIIEELPQSDAQHEDTDVMITPTKFDFFKGLHNFITQKDDQLYEALVAYVTTPKNAELIADAIIQKCQQTFYLHGLIKRSFHSFETPSASQELLKKLFVLLKMFGGQHYQTILCQADHDGVSVVQQVVVSSFAQQNLAAVKYVVYEVKSTLSPRAYLEMLFSENCKGKSVIHMASHWEDKACLSFFGKEVNDVIHHMPANHANRIIILEKLIHLAGQLKLNKKLSDADRCEFINRLASIVGVNDLALFIDQIGEAARQHDLKRMLITLAPPVSKSPHYGWGFIRQIDNVVKNNNYYFLSLFLNTIDLPSSYTDIKKFVLKEMQDSSLAAVRELCQQYEARWEMKTLHAGRNGFFATNGVQSVQLCCATNGHSAVQINGEIDVKQSDIRP